jgi:ElaB/YqjD/DUF883 family membrane-anchored ribosome-binding protein
MKTTEQIKTELEAILDSSKLERVMEALGEICCEKAEHIRANWQDEALAQKWERAGNKLAGVSINHLISRV